MARARSRRRGDPLERFEWAVVVAAVLAGAFVIFPDAGNPVDLIKATLIVVAGLMLVALFAVRMFRERAMLLPDRRFTISVGLFALGLIVSALLASQHAKALVGTYMRWTGAVPYLAYALIGLTVARVANTDRRRRTMSLVILWSGVALALYALMQRVDVDPIPWNLVYGSKAPSALGNPNFASAFFAIPVPIAAARIVDRRSGTPWPMVGALVVLFAGMWATGSFLGPFGALAGLAIGFALLLASSEETRSRLIGWAVIGGGTAAGLVLGVLWFVRAIPTPDQVGIRMYYWKAGLQMWLDNPLTGVGFGRYQDFFRRSRSAEGLEIFGPGALPDGPHGVFVTLLTEGGLIAFLPYLVVVGVLCWYAWKSIQMKERRSETLLAVGLAGALGAYLAQSIGNYNVPQLAILGWVIAGMVVANAAPERWRVELSPPLGYSISAIAALVVIVGLVLVWTPLRADILGREAIVFEARDDFAPGVDAAVQAADLAYWESRYRHTAGRLAYNAGDREASYQHFTQAATTFPEEWDPVLAAAQISAETGRYDESVSWYRRAVVIDPFDSGVRNEFGQALMLAGNNEEAVQVFEGLVADDPTDIQSWGFLGEAYSRLGRDADAEAAFDRVAELEEAGG